MKSHPHNGASGALVLSPSDVLLPLTSTLVSLPPHPLNTLPTAHILFWQLPPRPSPASGLCDADLSAWTPVRRSVIVTLLAESMCCPYREHGAPERTHDLEQRSGLRMYASICLPSRAAGMGSAPSFPPPNTLDPAASRLPSCCTLVTSYSRDL